jgi:dipeptidase D
MEVKHLAPEIVWSIFDEITRVPRPSKKEGKIRAWLVNFAEQHHLECHVDETGNVLMRKPATPGYEDHQTIVLQGHIDMVCEKNGDVEHDFENDPIETYIDGDWLKARGTTLGADNGIGVALSLAALTDDSYQHGPLEALFTYDEETGMSGANALKEGFMTGKTLINLDSEEENQIFIGCAGGMDTLATFRYAQVPAPKEYYYAEISVSSLLGGHSGGDIHLGHANANKILTRFLLSQPNLVLAHIQGGNLRNAIAREASAVFGIPFNRKDNMMVDFNRFVADIEGEVGDIEHEMKLDIRTAEAPESIIEPGVSDRLLMALQACPHGVVGMSRSMPGLVETSTNLASVKMNEPGVIAVETSQRSSVESEKNDIAHTVETVFKLAGADVCHRSSYPGWKPNTESPIMKVCHEAYVDLFKSDPEIMAIHAGLECGLFLTKYPEMDMVSIGPTMQNVHSPKEQLLIPSVARFWNFLREILSRC